MLNQNRSFVVDIPLIVLQLLLKLIEIGALGAANFQAIVNAWRESTISAMPLWPS